jgi:sialate O-acetylesterase
VNAEAMIAASANPQIRLLHVPERPEQIPAQDQPAKWELCGPASTPAFSAIGYLFAKDIQATEHVPVGIIQSAYGATPGEAWISRDALVAEPKLIPLEAYWAHEADTEGENPPVAKEGGLRITGALARQPGVLFNSMISPLVRYGIKGALWYQGEGNSFFEKAPLYSDTLETLIRDWRERFEQGNFPFLIVQISSYKGVGSKESWGELRDQQRQVLRVANTALAVSLDKGDPTTIHPKDKIPVADRLALAARALAYGENVDYCGPLFRQAAPDGSGIRAWFDHGAGLMARGGEVKSFELYGSDNQWHPATATIEGDSVFVTGPGGKPRYVRYGWTNFTNANLYNAAGLPASTFTDAPVSVAIIPLP